MTYGFMKSLEWGLIVLLLLVFCVGLALGAWVF
jgi:F0F1-type ATP synthase assembly protein I